MKFFEEYVPHFSCEESARDLKGKVIIVDIHIYIYIYVHIYIYICTYMVVYTIYLVILYIFDTVLQGLRFISVILKYKK